MQLRHTDSEPSGGSARGSGGWDRACIEGFDAGLQLDVGSATVRVGGELDLVNAPAVAELLRRAEAHAPLIIVDLRDVSFIDSSGLHVAVTANARIRRSGGRLVIVQGPRQMRRIFELAGIDEPLEMLAVPPAELPATKIEAIRECGAGGGSAGE
jgi:anti-anti-sigma factor